MPGNVQPKRPRQSTRVIALVGPQSSGKTQLLESILFQTGALDRRSANGSHIFGDFSDEAKARQMGTELNIATTQFMGENYTFIDCPGSIELSQESLSILPICDAAIVVTETDTSKIVSLAPLLKTLEDLGVPHYIFANKVDLAGGSIAGLADALRSVTQKPIVLRQIPIRTNDEITGYADLAHGRAYVYQDGEPSKQIDIPDDLSDRFGTAQYEMLETLADFDDHLMEELLEDTQPPREEICQDLAKELQEGLIIPVLMGSALKVSGVHRLLKALRHETPDLENVQLRLGVETDQSTAQVLKTFNQQHLGKLSLARILAGTFSDNDKIGGEAPSGLFTLHGDKSNKTSSAQAGDVVAFAKLDKVQTGHRLNAGGDPAPAPDFNVLHPVFTVALEPTNRKDEVKLVSSLIKICEEDPSLVCEQNAESNEILLRGQGDLHIKLALDRLNNRFGVAAKEHLPKIPYRETIRKSAKHHSRYKKQSGGHGQFGDVVVEIAPVPAGTGFEFSNTITGGAIPKQYIPSVEAGVKDYLRSGPLGFPVVDVGVKLVDGSYHSVDSSDMAFKMAGRMAMSEALPECQPVLLEPIMKVSIMAPSEFTGQINSIVSSRRGHILGFDGREGWPGWDAIEAHIPQAELHDLIIELRSVTLGSATYESDYDHLSELTGRLADQVVQSATAE